MSNKYLFILILVCSILVSFTFIFLKVNNLEDLKETEFKPEYEADFFNFPVGKPAGTDYGDSIFSIANGLVTFAKDVKGGWGQVIRIKHKFKGEYYESLYAHCSKMEVKVGDWINRGFHIGNIGDYNGKYLAHLHFELRDSMDMPIGGGYSSEENGYLNPTEFIQYNYR